MRLVRADLSAPVLAILVTIGIIAAGLVLLAWFFWFAPQAGRVGSLQVLGTPVILCYTTKDNTNTYYKANLTISVRNTGNADVTVQNATIAGLTAIYINGEINSISIPPGNSTTLVFTFGRDNESNAVKANICGVNSVEGYIVTDYGIFSFSAVVLRG